MGQVDDVAECVTMDLKAVGNKLYLVGETKEELAGSHFALVNKLTGGAVPAVDPQVAKQTFAAMHAAIKQGNIRSCHDLSEGGLAVAAAEMAFAGNIGASLDLSLVPVAEASYSSATRLFSESNTRFLCEVTPEQSGAFEAQLAGIPHACIGETVSQLQLTISESTDGTPVIQSDLTSLKEHWQSPLA